MKAASTRASDARRASPPERLSRVFLPGEAELLQQMAGKMGIIARPKAGFDIGKRRCKAGKIRLLRQISDNGAWLRENRAAIRFDLSGGDFEQGRFARSVASNKCHPLAGRDGQLDAGQKRRAAEGQRDVLELKKGWCHVAVSAAEGTRPRRGVRSAG